MKTCPDPHAHPLRRLPGALLLAGLLSLCTSGGAITIDRSYVLSGGALPPNFVTTMRVDAELQGLITVRSLTIENDVSYSSPRFLFDQEVYFSGFSSIGLPRDLAVPIPLNVAPFQTRVVMGGDTLFPGRLGYTQTVGGTITSNAQIFTVKALETGTIDTRAIGLHMQLYNWAGVDYTDINILQTTLRFQARMTDYQIFHDPLSSQLTIEAGDRAYNAVAFTNTGTIVSADTALTNRVGAVLVNRGFIWHTTRGAVLGNEGELINEAGGRIISNIVNSGTLTNFGDLQLAPAGTDPTHLSVNDTTGVILGLAGTLSVDAGGRFFNHGHIAVAAGASFTGNGSITSDGTLLLEGGNFTAGLTNRGQVSVTKGSVFTGSVLNRDNAQFSVFDGMLVLKPDMSLINEFGGTVFIGTLGSLQNDGRFDGESPSLLHVQGTFANTATGIWSNNGAAQFDAGSLLSNAAGGVIYNRGQLVLSGPVVNDGLLSSSGGVLRVEAGAVLFNGGRLDIGGNTLASNAGTLTNMFEVEIRGDARFSNLHEFAGGGGLSVTSSHEAGLANLGSLKIEGDGRFFVGSSAHVVNAGAAELSLRGGGAVVEGKLDNDGWLDIGANGLASKGIITNAGLISSEGAILNTGVLVNQSSLLSSGTLYNSDGGVFLGDTGSATRSVGFDNRADVIIAKGAQLLVNGDYTQDLGSTVVEGQLTADNIVILGGSLAGAAGRIVGNLVIGSTPERRARHGAGDAQGGVLSAALIIEGNLLVEGGTLAFDIGGLAAAEHDVLTVTGSITFVSGTLALNFINDFVPGEGYYFPLVSPGERTGLDGAMVTVTGLPEGYEFAFQASGALVVTAVPAPVPEPAAWLLALGGLAVLAGRRVAASPGTLRPG